VVNKFRLINNCFGIEVDETKELIQYRGENLSCVLNNSDNVYFMKKNYIYILNFKRCVYSFSSLFYTHKVSKWF
jgi:hypothetical protein